MNQFYTNLPAQYTLSAAVDSSFRNTGIKRYMRIVQWSGKMIALLMLFMLTTYHTQAANRFSVATGNWSATSTWSATSGGAAGASVPVAGDVVTIEGGDNVTVNINNAECASVQIGSPTGGGGAGTLTFALNSQLIVSGTVTLGNSGSTTRFGTITMTAGGNLICASMTSNSTTDVFTEGTGTVQFTGTFNLSQTDAGAQLASFNNLVINGGTVTLANTVVILGNLTITSGILDLSTFTCNRSSAGGTLTVAGTLKLGSNAGGQTGSNYPTNFTTNSLTGGTVDYDRAGTQTVYGSVNYDNLTLSGTNTKTLTTGMTSISGNLTISGSATTNTVVGLTIAGQLNIGDGTSFTAAAFALAVTGQTTVGGGTSGTLTISSAIGTKAFNGDVTVNAGAIWNNTAGNAPLTLPGSISNAGTFNAGSGIYTLSGSVKTISGTFSIPSVTISGSYTNNGTLSLATALAGGGSLTNGPTGILNIDFSSAPSITTLIASTPGNVVDYGYAGVQTVKPIPYHHLTLSGSGVKTLTSVNTINGDFTLSGSVTATPASALAVAGTTSIGGTSILTLGATEILSNTGAVTLNGGTFRTGTTTGYSEIMGTLSLNATSTIALGTGTHTITFAASDAVAWSGATTLTIRGWAGSWNGTTGTSGKIFVGSTSGGLTTGQLSQIQFFNGTNNIPAVIISTGEIVPSTVPPSNLSYPSPNAFITGIAITPLNPTVTGVVTSYGVVPSLPAGLNLNISTGVINGTPTAITASATYTVTATNVGGSTTFGVVISVGNARYAVASAAWNATSTWSASSGGAAGASVPVAGDIVYIGEAAVARAVTIPAGYAASCSSITLGNTGNAMAHSITLSANTSSLSVSGNITVNAPSANAVREILVNQGIMTINGNLYLSAGASGNQAGRINRVTITSGTANVNGNLVYNTNNYAGVNVAQNQVVMGASSAFNLAGNFTINVSGTLTPGANSTFNFNGITTGQTIPVGVSGVIYNNLTINNTFTSGAILSAAISATNVTGNLRVLTGLLNNGGFAIAGNAAKTFEVANGATLVLTGTSSMPTGFGTNTIGNSSDINYAGAGQNVIARTYGYLNFSGTGTKTATGAITVNSTTTLNGITFATGATTGYSSNLGVLSMTSSSTIALGTGVHTLTLANSSSASWAGTLNITGWGTGAVGIIQVGVGGLSSAQLSQVVFAGYSAGAKITSSGQLIPIGNWQAQFISMNTGSSTWCSGETRTVTVTVKNVGLSTWTNTGPDINIGVKWSAEADYLVRTNANNLAPGATQTYSLTVTAPSTSATNTLTFDVVNEMVCWFANNGTCGPGNTVFTSPTLTVNLPPVATSASNQTTNSFSANWTAASGADGYRLDVSTDNFTTYVSGYQDKDVLNVLTFPVSGLTAGITYYYRLRAYYASSGCTTDNSNTISVITQVQATGDYRSAGTGTWATPATWERYNGTTWVAAATAPTATTAGIINIQSGHNVTVAANTNGDQMTINGTLTINAGITFTVANGPGTDLTVNGTVLNAGTMTMTGTAVFNSGSFYKHNFTTSPGTIPNAAWNTGSTCEIVGNTNNTAAPGGLGQTFYNFRWNCASQSVALNLGGGLRTINGDFSVTSTGGLNQLILTNTSALTMSVGGDFKMGIGNLDFSNAAAATKVLNIGGNYIQNIGSFTNSNSNVLTINFTGSGKSFTQSSGALTSTYMNWNVNNGASITLNDDLLVAAGRTCTVNGTLDCGILSAVTGAGSFILSSGATLIIGSNAGISAPGTATGNVLVTTARTYSTGSNYHYNNSGAQATGSGLPSAVNNLTVNGSNPLTLTNSTSPVSPFTIQNLTIQSGKFEIGALQQLTVSGTTSLSGTECLVLKSNSSGTASFVNNGISGSGTAKVERYVAAANWATWNDGWHFLSSPVSSQPISAFTTSGSGNDYDFYAWWEPLNLWVNYKNTTVIPTFSTANGGTNFVVGKGYLVAYEQSSTKAFSGTLNYSSVNPTGLTNNSTTANHSWNLLGNPFPASLTWDASWTKTNIGANCQIWNEALKDYSIITPGNIIPALNGFMVEATAASGISITIPSGKQTHSSTAWYKSSKSFNQLKLTVMAADSSSGKETFFQLNPLSTALFDPEFDGHFLHGYGPIFYSLAGIDTLSVNTVPAITDSLEIPLVFQKNEGSEYVIKATGVESFERPIYLNDLKLGTTRNLGTSPVYAFSSADGDNANRFSLSFKSPNSINEDIAQYLNVIPWNGNITITTDHSTTGMVRVTDMTGRILATEKINGLTLHIDLDAVPGVYIVSLNTMTKTYCQKVVIR